LPPSARSGNLIAGDGTKNALPAPNKELVINRKEPLDRKSPIQVRIQSRLDRPFIAEQVIGHTQAGVHRVYDLHRYREEKREALVRWEERLREIVG